MASWTDDKRVILGQSFTEFLLDTSMDRRLEWARIPDQELGYIVTAESGEQYVGGFEYIGHMDERSDAA